MERSFEPFSVWKNICTPAFSMSIFILSSVGRANRTDKCTPDMEPSLVEIALVLRSIRGYSDTESMSESRFCINFSFEKKITLFVINCLNWKNSLLSVSLGIDEIGFLCFDISFLCVFLNELGETIPQGWKFYPRFDKGFVELKKFWVEGIALRKRFFHDDIEFCAIPGNNS